MAKSKPQPKKPLSDEAKLLRLEKNTPALSEEELEALLSEAEDGEPADLDEEYELAKQTVVPRARAAVAQVVHNPPLEPAPSVIAEQPTALDIFEGIVESRPDFNQALDSVFMVGKLITNLYDSGEYVCKQMGFDPDNLLKHMQAQFCLATGTYVTEEDINSYFTQPNRGLRDIIYYDLLGLNDDSTEDEMKQRVSETTEDMKEYFKDLLKFRKRLLVGDALMDIAEDRESEEGRSPEEAQEAVTEILKAYGFSGNPLPHFDEDAIEEVLAEVQGLPTPERATGTAPSGAPEAAAEGEVNYAEFYSKNQTQPAMRMLYRLHHALSNPDQLASKYKDLFNGEEAQAVVSRLNETLEQLGSAPSLGYDLLIASEGTDTHALLEQIAVSFNITNPVALKAKMEEVYQAIQRQYPNLSPVPVAAPTPAQPTFDYEAFYEALAEEPVALKYLFYALKGDNKEYDDNYRFTHFDGDSRIEVMESVDEILGDGMAVKLRDAARKTDANDQTTYIQVIAESFPRITNNPKAIEHVLRQITAKLAVKYPKIML